MHLYIFTKPQIKKIKRVIRNFLWSSKTSKTSLNNIIYPIKLGGLGLLDIELVNKSLSLSNLCITNKVIHCLSTSYPQFSSQVICPLFQTIHHGPFA